MQINTIAVLVNLSLAKLDKIKIIRAEIVPLLIKILKYGSEESQKHEDENRSV